MTDLQASLMVIGGTIVAGVISYNKWQEYKAKKTVQRAFSSEHDDVLMNPHMKAPLVQEERLEPNFVAEVSADAAERENAPSTSVEAQPANLQDAPPQPKELPVDELIDCTRSAGAW